MLAFDPETVQQDTAKALPDTQLVLDDLVEWRKGHDTSKRITPQGYFGDPATGTAERGRRVIADEARVIADALQQRLG
jgi:creatinine amidohydrolase